MTTKVEIQTIPKVEVDAAFNVVHAQLVAYIQQKVPFFLKGTATSMLTSAEGKKALYDMITEGLIAAQAAAPKPKATKKKVTKK